MSTLVITLPLGSPQAPADYSYTLTVDGHNATQQASASAALGRAKAAFDPARLLNPDKAIPTLARCAEYGKMHVRKGLLPHPDLPRF